MDTTSSTRDRGGLTAVKRSARDSPRSTRKYLEEILKEQATRQHTSNAQQQQNRPKYKIGVSSTWFTNIHNTLRVLPRC